MVKFSLYGFFIPALHTVWSVTVSSFTCVTVLTGTVPETFTTRVNSIKISHLVAKQAGKNASQQILCELELCWFWVFAGSLLRVMASARNNV